VFRDRAAAGDALADALAPRLSDRSCRVYGLARGGVVIGRAIAERCGLPLEVLVACKIGAPGQPELAVGAIAEGGVPFWDAAAIEALALTPEWCAEAAAAATAEVRRRVERYRGHELTVDARELALVVDDGLATGSTMVGALRGLASLGAARRAVAAPVASGEAIELLEPECDWVVALEVPDPFYAVGAHYQDFEPVDDRELLRALGTHA
jgi:putative phosphoribosyl transferase